MLIFLEFKSFTFIEFFILETTELTNETKKVIDEEVDQYLQVVLNKFQSDSGEVLSHEINIHETGKFFI